MFSEYGLYLGTTLVGLVCDDQLYLKPTPQGRALIGTPVDAAPYPGAKPSFLITADRWENADWLKTLLAATASALPAAKPKAKSPAKAKTTSP